MINLLQGDCLEIMKEIPDGSIDMVLCDLPYGTTACKWDNIIPFVSLWEQYNRIIKDNAAVVLFATQPFTTALINSNIKMYRYNWYWNKKKKIGFTYAKYQPMRCIEDICVFYRKNPEYNPQGLIKIENPKEKIKTYNGKDCIVDMKGLIKPHIPIYKNYPSHLLEFKKDTKSFHPTQKPIQLLEYLIATYTRPRRRCIG